MATNSLTKNALYQVKVKKTWTEIDNVKGYKDEGLHEVEKEKTELKLYRAKELSAKMLSGILDTIKKSTGKNAPDLPVWFESLAAKRLKIDLLIIDLKYK